MTPSCLLNRRVYKKLARPMCFICFTRFQVSGLLPFDSARKPVRAPLLFFYGHQIQFGIFCGRPANKQVGKSYLISLMFTDFGFSFYRRPAGPKHAKLRRKVAFVFQPEPQTSWACKLPASIVNLCAIKAGPSSQTCS